MEIKEIINKYMNNPGNFSEKTNSDGSKQICDINSGECYTITEKDGLIERFDYNKISNRRINVNTPNGVKQLLND